MLKSNKNRWLRVSRWWDTLFALEKGIAWALRLVRQTIRVSPTGVLQRREGQRRIILGLETLEAREMLSGTQWATSITCSSEFSSTAWSASQALGAPDTFAYGDIPTAWAPLPVNGSQEFLGVGFDTSVNATGVAIRETCGNGFVTQVDLVDTDGNSHTVFNGTDPTQPGAPAYLTIDFSATSYLVSGVNIYVDTNHDMTTWEEIDAVGLTDGNAPNPAKLAATIVVNAYGGTYDGTAHGLTGSATGTDNTDLSSLLDLGPTEIDGGTYNIPWTFAGNADYAAASGTSSINIGQADATISVSPYSGTYDGVAHSPSGAATGVLGEGTE